MAVAEVVVVGTGVMGAAAARSLARAGREVVMLERFGIGHHHGSSHGPARIFRLSYGDPLYVRMAQEALPLWRELEVESGEALLTTTGGLDLGGSSELELHASALEACGAAFERLPSKEVHDRFPALSVGAESQALFQPETGVLNSKRAWQAFVDSATASGATLRDGERVLSLAEVGGLAEIRTESETIRARVGLVTAGAWTRGLLTGIGIELHTVPTRETIGYFRFDGDVPVVVEWGDPARFLLPVPGFGIRSGEHHAGPETDPDALGEVDQESISRTSAWLEERLPGVEATPHVTEACIYTNTEDESFLLERHGPFVIGSACSGHGFKFAPLIGEQLAALAVDRS
ncbi:MAG: FAD-dependent oxidoreductase [Actinomycetota bacterium]